MTVNYTWEHNGNDTLIWLDDFPGASVRGDSREAALGKAAQELASYLRWRDGTAPAEALTFSMRRDYAVGLQVADADSDSLLDCERVPLTAEDYERLKELALRSAACFAALYASIPDKTLCLTRRRQTFYGQVPSSAEEMYRHTKNVNAYCFAQIGIDADNDPDILTCREEGFRRLERQPDFLQNPVIEGDYDELWSLRKLCRRFIWHDRIHGKAMYRQAIRRFGAENIANPFCF